MDIINTGKTNYHHHHRHHYHHYHHIDHQQQHKQQEENQHTCSMGGDNGSSSSSIPSYKVGLKSKDCVMSRLSPFESDHGSFIAMSQDNIRAPISILDAAASAAATTVFNPDNTINMSSAGLDPSGALFQPFNRVIHSPCLQLDGLRYESSSGRLDPHSPLCMVPLPEHIGEPSFIRRRNERERERVRCVNDGYDRLKEHLPLADKDRRLSKVETLRGAIKYIRQLKRLLEESEDEHDETVTDICKNNIGAARNKRYNMSSSRKHRRSSLSSSDLDSSLSDS